MSRSTRLMYLLYVTMLSFHATIVTAQSNQEVARDQVGFRSVLSDSEIGTLINTYNVKPTAVFMWMSGLSATHRVNDDMTAEEIIQSARNETEIFLLNTLEANNERLKRFSSFYRGEQIVSDENLENQVRSLLNIQSQLEEALLIVRSNRPMIYGVEVSGDPYFLSQLRLDDMIETSISTNLSNTVGIDRRALKPELYREEYIDISILEANSSELHSIMLEKIMHAPEYFRMMPKKI